MKQAENKAYVEGYLNAINLEDYTKDSKQFLKGDIEIAVPTGNNEAPMDIIPISVFIGEKKKNGDDNPAYKGLQTLQTECTSIAACGDRAKADKIRVNLASIAMNEFAVPGGMLISHPRVSANFFNRVTSDFAPQAKFNMIIVIGSITREIDSDENETGRLVVRGIVPQYGDKVDVMPFFVESKEAIAHIERNWKPQDTVRVAGRIKFQVMKEKIPVEVGFGDPVFEEKTRNLRELIIVSGSGGGLAEEDGGYSPEEIAKALDDRKARLEEMKSKAASQTKSETKKDDYGF